ncbi:hypothetical protein D3C75_781890 [compost metagenome]
MSMVQLNKYSIMGERLSWLPFPEQIATLEEVAMMITFRRHPLWGEHQDALISQGKEIRAFPHKTHAFVSLGENTFVVPLTEIGGAVQAHLASILHAGTDNHVPELTFAPHLRIAKMMQSWRCINHHAMPFKMDAVTAACQALHLVEIVVGVCRTVKFMSGINQRQRIAVHHGGAGETAVFIRRAFRGQRNR